MAPYVDNVIEYIVQKQHEKVGVFNLPQKPSSDCTEEEVVKFEKKALKRNNDVKMQLVLGSLFNLIRIISTVLEQLDSELTPAELTMFLSDTNNAPFATFLKRHFITFISEWTLRYLIIFVVSFVCCLFIWSSGCTSCLLRMNLSIHLVTFWSS